MFRVYLHKISPLFNRGNKQDPSNYRPISVLPTISKLLEKAVHMQLYSYLRDNNLLSQKQFGFRLVQNLVLKPFKLVYPKAPFWVPYCLRVTSTIYQITWITVT